MTSLPIVTEPDERLRRKAADVQPSNIPNRAFQQFIDQMIETMFTAQGVGLAANQVGDPRSIAVVSTKDGPLVLINPRIIRYGLGKESAEEGCLSVPGVWGEVRRSTTVRVAAYDRQGGKLDIKAKGLFARIIQHEVDHLNGVLIIDKAKNLTKIRPDNHDDL